MAGIVLASYLTWTHYYPPENDFCTLDPFWDCGKVRESPYSEVLGLPVAVIGLGGFVAILVLILLRFLKYDWPLTERFPLLILVFALVGAAFGTYLTYLEFFVILAVCILCLASFLIILATVALAVPLWRMA